MNDGWKTPGGSGENSIDISSPNSKFYVPAPSKDPNANKQVNDNGENVSDPTKNDNNDNKTTTEELTSGKKHSLKK